MQITCEFTNLEEIQGLDNDLDDLPEYYTLKILNAFRRTSVLGENEFAFLLPGIRNPIHTKPTASFQFKTFTRQNEIIDESLDGTFVQMTQNAEITTIQVSLGSYTNSMPTDYTITLVPTVPISKESVVYLVFPE